MNLIRKLPVVFSGIEKYADSLPGLDSAHWRDLKAVKHRFRLLLSSIFFIFSVGIDTEKAYAQAHWQKDANAGNVSLGSLNDTPVSLGEVIRQVESNHPKITGATVERRVAEAKLLEKQGAFDPVFSTSSEFLRYNSTSTPGKAAFAFQNQGMAEWTTRSGMKFFAGARSNQGRVKSPLSSTGTVGEFFAGVAMPLLRDRNVNAKAIAEQQSAIGINIAETGVVATRFEVVRAASESYWEWVAAKQKLGVNENIYEIARTRAGQIAARVASGDLPPIDSTEAALEVQRRMGNVVKARRDLQKAGLKLGLYLWKSNGEPDEVPPPERAPDKFPQPNPLPDFVLKEGLERALNENPELQRLELEQKQTALDERLARNNRRPRVDLYLAPGQDTGFNSVGTTFKFGAAIELPLRTRTADGQIAAARLKIEKNDLQQRLVRQTVTTQVNDAAQAVNAAHDAYLLALQELELSRTLERGERQRFAVGDSTLFLVNQRERATAEAEVKLIDTQVVYEQALIAFKIVTLRY